MGTFVGAAVNDAYILGELFKQLTEKSKALVSSNQPPQTDSQVIAELKVQKSKTEITYIYLRLQKPMLKSYKVTIQASEHIFAYNGSQMSIRALLIQDNLIEYNEEPNDGIIVNNQALLLNPLSGLPGNPTTNSYLFTSLVAVINPVDGGITLVKFG